MSSRSVLDGLSFSVPSLIYGWNADRVCWFSTLLREVFLWVLRFPPLWFTVSPISRVLDYWMNKGIFIIVFTIVIVYKTVDSNLKEFCASNVYFFDSSSQKNFKFQLWFLVQNSINLHVAIFLAVRQSRHRNSLNDLKSSEVEFSKILLWEILLMVDKSAWYWCKPMW